MRPRRIFIALGLRRCSSSVAFLDELEHFILIGYFDLCESDDDNFLPIVLEYFQLSFVV